MLPSFADRCTVGFRLGFENLWESYLCEIMNIFIK